MAEARDDSTQQPESKSKQDRGKKARAPRILQEDVPAYSLDQALRVPRAIAENYAYKPTRPLNVAGAMGMTPTSGPFRTLTGAAVAYGLTTGAAQAPEIGLTPLGLRVVRPVTEGDDLAAKREALLKPRIVGDFLRSYDGAALPSDNIAKNVLQERGVPAERVADVLELILEGAESVGFLRQWGGRRYVDLAGSLVADGGQSSPALDEPQPDVAAGGRLAAAPTSPAAVSVAPGIHINIEIHIAADASSDTIQEIFRNMRRYVLASDGQVEDDLANGQ